MGGQIDCYLDIASLYSYLTFLDLTRNRDFLTAHSAQVNFHPVLLGGINAGSGNKPPWTLPAKAAYGVHDARRSIARFPGLNLQLPDDLMSISHTIIPLRALHHIQRIYAPSVFETCLHYLFHCFWAAPRINLTRPENVAKALSEAPVGFKGEEVKAGAERLFNGEEVKAIMAAAASQEVKDVLKATTQEALERGAFGAPWLWVTNSAGEAQPFFGSDRFHFVYKFLDLPFQDVALLPPAEQEKQGKISKL
ncbi:thioredoxin-like protein [Lasiosphaeria hispida]|uniref:Glutathione S-transferase kappa n=1 Tax=Lasiosphaeria hispida TaxID=260671 RepID=A0AAJ0MGA5_9PEZI|nr:thioredoxin-like protein [Lasiosphaeria hispida]